MKSVTSGLVHLLNYFCFKNNLNIEIKSLGYNVDERIPISEWLSYIERIESEISHDALGLEIAKYVQPFNLGILGYIVQTCESLLEALSLFLKYQRLCYDFMKVDVSSSSNEIIISWELDFNCNAVQLFDQTMSGIIFNFSKQLVNPYDLRVNKIEFVSGKPKSIKSYTNYFGCPVEFNKKKTTMYFPFSSLELKVNKRDPYLNEILNKQAEKILCDLPELESFNELVRKEMIKAILQDDINIDNIAKKFGMSSRKFQSILKENGYNFRSRLNKIRRDLAFEYLADNNLSILDISILLSYREQTSFIRAFKDWTGFSPLQYRKRILE